MTGIRWTTKLAGVSFPHVDLDAAIAQLLSPQGLATALPWRLVNTYSLSLARTDARYAAILRGPGVNLADGRPVARLLEGLSHRAGVPTAPSHVRGPDFFTQVLDAGQRAGVRHYLLGGSPATLTTLQATIAERFPGAKVAGSWSPPFRPLTDEERAAQDQRIADSGTDLIWVGIGTPRQDIEAARLTAVLGRPAIGIGAAFDFLAGSRPEAPLWMQRATLEWLFRLASEPRRLWRRYTFGVLSFAAVVVPDLLSAHPQRFSVAEELTPVLRDRPLPALDLHPSVADHSNVLPLNGSRVA